MSVSIIPWSTTGWYSSYGGVSEDAVLKRSVDKGVIYVGLADSLTDAEEPEIKRGTKIALQPTSTCSPNRRYRVMVEANPALYDVASIQYEKIVEHGSEGGVVYATFTKACDLSELEYLVRYYLLG